MAEDTKTITDKKVCLKCGLVHDIPVSPDENKGDEWKILGLSAVGIVMIVLIWIWVFRWGVPLVKQLSGS